MNTKELKIKKIHQDAILPSYAQEGDAGLDLFSIEEKVLEPFETVLVATGLQIELPQNTEAQIRPRSGLALKHNLTILNSPGTIDQGYRGEIKIILSNFGKENFTVKKGMKIAQMVVMPVLTVNIAEVKKLNDSSRGEDGFGSTGV